MLTLNNAVENLMEMFRNQNFPEQVAFTIIKRRNTDSAAKPSDRWSLGNLLIMAFIGKTSDARTFKQWQAANRHVKRGSKAFNIFLLTVSFVSAKYSLLSEWPKTTYFTPASTSIAGEISPV